MDSPFNRQYSLYESVSNRPYGSSTSLNNLAKSTSRLGSPAVPPTSLGSDIGRRVNSPKVEPSSMGQGAAQSGWNTAPQPDLKDGGAAAGQPTAGATDRFSGFGAFASTVPTGYSGMGYPYNSSAGSLMGYPGYAGSSVYGNAGSAYGNTTQYAGQYASSNQYSQPTAQYMGGSAAYVNAYGQYANPYGGSQYGSSNNLFNTGGVQGESSDALAGTNQDAAALKNNVARRATGDGGTPAVPASLKTSASTSLVTSPDTAAQDELLAPANIFWNYIDLQGQVQGPFSGLQMNEWLAYMMDVTLVRRVNDKLFVSFGLLKEVTGSSEPFIALLSASAWASVMLRAAELTEQRKSEASATAQQKQQQQVQQVQQAQVQQPTEQSQPDSNGSQQQQPAADKRAAENEGSFPGTSRESSLAPGDNVAPSLAALKVTENEAANEPRTTYNNITSPVITGATIPQPAEGSKSEPVRAPASDPWKKTSKPPAQISIAELKQQELDKQQRKKGQDVASPTTPASRKSSQGRWLPIEQLQGSPEVQNVAKAASSTPVSSSGSAASATSPAPATWKKAVTPARSLADIQKEQALRSKQANSTPAAASPVAGSKPAPKSAAQPRVEASPAVKGRFHALDEETHPGQTTPSSKPRRSAQQHSGPVSITANASKARLTDELVHWTRISFKDLIKGIDAMELLEVFLSLPANGSAKEFIAESIYSYSKTLDGRRFASEFLSRKKAAEDSMSPGETWQDVLNRFNPNVVEQDPSFKVVTKKRTQKIARPGDSMHI